MTRSLRTRLAAPWARLSRSTCLSCGAADATETHPDGGPGGLCKYCKERV